MKLKRFLFMPIVALALFSCSSDKESDEVCSYSDGITCPDSEEELDVSVCCTDQGNCDYTYNGNEVATIDEIIDDACVSSDSLETKSGVKYNEADYAELRQQLVELKQEALEAAIAAADC